MIKRLLVSAKTKVSKFHPLSVCLKAVEQYLMVFQAYGQTKLMKEAPLAFPVSLFHHKH